LISDGDLVRQTWQGDCTAREELVRRWAARLLAFCHSRVDNHHLAEDLAQESLLRAMRNLRTLESPEKFGMWLCGIALRICHDWRKARQSSQVPFTCLAGGRHPDEIAVTSPEAVEAEMDRRDQTRLLMAEVESLPEKQREVLMLYYYQDVTYHDLAQMLGVSFATINARLTQARAILRERLAGVGRCRDEV
jgi:RNA polymerase sigma factor (sigma-70 family)